MTESYDDLIRRVREAPEAERRQLLDELVSQFAGAAYRWALLVLEDENAACDAVQDAWLSAYLHLDQLRESAAFPAWFRQIVIASSHHAIRGEKPSIPLTEDAAEPTTPDPTEEIEHRERRERVREAVQALPEHERVVTELFYFADYPQQQIAEVLALPLTTVKKRLQYARERLRGMIQPDILASLDALKPNGLLERSDMPDNGLPFIFPYSAGLEWQPFNLTAAPDTSTTDDAEQPIHPFYWTLPR
jgi:RNA polymerase sigma factor (sigma-70 family)